MIDVDDYGLMLQGDFEKLIVGIKDERIVNALIEYHEHILRTVEELENRIYDLDNDIRGSVMED